MDQTLFHLINQQWTRPALDLFMAAISDFKIWLPLIVVVVVVVLILGKFRARAFVVCLGLALLLNASVTAELKRLVDRRRPKQVQSVRMVELAKGTPHFLKLFRPVKIRYSDTSDRKRSGPSFPSGHVTNNVTIAVVLSYFYRRWGWLYFFFAGAIAWSRIYLGAHWPSDVVATFFLSLGTTFFLLAVFETVYRWGAAKWATQFFVRHPQLASDLGA